MNEKVKNRVLDKAMEEQKLSQFTRRNILKTTLAGGTVATTGALPKRWIRPAIESVVLPAHAVTTCDRIGLTIPGRTSTCPVFDTSDEFFLIDDTTPCEPKIVITEDLDLDDPDIPFFSFGISFSAGDFDRIGSIYNGSLTDSQSARLLDPPPRETGVCPTTVVETGGPFVFTVQGTSGSDFTASGSIIATPGTITLSNIALVPI